MSLNISFLNDFVPPNCNPYSNGQSKEAVQAAEHICKDSSVATEFRKQSRTVLLRASDNLKPEYVQEWKHNMEVVALLEGKYLKTDIPKMIFDYMVNLRMQLLFCILDPPQKIIVFRV